MKTENTNTMPIPIYLPPPPPPSISVVIPIYNADKTLVRCLESIRTQTFYDFECILVDDGSTDNSSALCDEYAEHDSRFTVIHQANCGGPGPVRVTGIRKARGKAIFLIDNDDSIEPETLELLYKKMIPGIKYVVTGIRGLRVDGKTFEWPPSQDLLSSADMNECSLKAASGNDAFIKVPLTGCLIDRTLFEQIQTPTIQLYEDHFMLIQILYQIKWCEIAVVSELLYNHTIDSSTSLTLKKMEQFRCDTFEDSNYNNNRLIYNFLLEHNLDDRTIKTYMIDTIMGFLHSVSLYLTLNKNKPARKEIEEFYTLYKKYKAEWQVKPYVKYIIPVFYHFPKLSRLYRFLLVMGNELRLTLRKLRSTIYN